ncbi:MAG TPA: PHB depolymerase family esterase [Polyangiaceae bacterium]|nr:PHB depolymerase family esterase [Polyangiaceae bacterium]
MTARRCAIGASALLLLLLGCTRADLYAITEGVGDATSGGAPSEPPARCPTPTLPAGDSTQMIQVGSLTRSFVLHVPKAPDGSKPVPLIVDLHGLGSSGMNELQNSPYPAVTDAEGVVIAFPDGLKGPLGTAWNLGPCCVADVDDVGFIRALVAQVQSTACIDSRRIYAVGVLTGGGMVYDLACRTADLFAAVAPAAFDLLQEDVDECIPSRPITEISFRGTDDPRVPYAGGASALVPGMPITFLGARATFQRWAQINRCTGAASLEDSNGCSSYSGCDAGVEVTLCTKQGGRDEPGNARIAWPVLKRHTL